MEDKEAKKKKSNSLKSILGGDILERIFFAARLNCWY